MTPHLRITTGRSRIASVSIAVAATASLALLVAIPLPWLARIFALLWIGACALDALLGVALRLGRRGVRAMCLRSPDVEVATGDGRVHEGELRSGSFVSPWLTIVRWRPRGAFLDRTIVVLPDMLEAESFRALRVVLRMG